MAACAHRMQVAGSFMKPRGELLFLQALPSQLSIVRSGKSWRCPMLAVCMTFVFIQNSIAQTGNSEDGKLPAVSIWRSGNGFVTEGEDAEFVLTAEPKPAANLVVDLHLSYYRTTTSRDPSDPRMLGHEVHDLDESTIQATIGESGEFALLVPTRDDDEDRPLHTLTVSIGPGIGYSADAACESSIALCPPRENPYAEEVIYSNPDRASVTVLDNDGPQSMNGEIAAATKDLLDQVGTATPTSAELRELRRLIHESSETIEDMKEGGVMPEEAQALLESSRKQIEISTRLASAGLLSAEEELATAVRTAYGAIRQSRPFPLPSMTSRDNPKARLAFDEEITRFLDSCGELTSAWISSREGTANLEVAGDFLEAVGEFVFSVYGRSFDENEFENISKIPQGAFDAFLASISTDRNSRLSLSDEIEFSMRLKSDRKLLQTLIGATGIELASNWMGKRGLLRGSSEGFRSTILRFDQEVPWRLMQAGLDGSGVDLLMEDLAEFADTDMIGLATVESGEEVYLSVSRLIDGAFGGAAETGYVEELLYTAIRTGDEYFAVNAASVKVVSTEIPDGLFVLEDGSALVIARGLAITLVPASMNIVSFAGYASALGYQVRLNRNGGIVLSGSDSRISASFSYGSNPANTGLESGTVEHYTSTSRLTFALPKEENPASPAHSITVVGGAYPDGEYGSREQRLLPRFASDSLYDFLASLGLEASTDWFETGVITIAGRGRFRPAYAFEGELPDESAIGPDDFRFVETDANGDGVRDYRVHIGDFSQLLYGVP